MFDFESAIKNANDILNRLPDTTGILRCALFYQLYAELDLIKCGVEEKEREWNEEKRNLELQIKDLEERINNGQ